MSFKNGEGLHLVMTGAPGTGKGTQASVLKRRYGICHLSTGEMLREEVKKGTEIGNQLKDHLMLEIGIWPPAVLPPMN